MFCCIKYTVSPTGVSDKSHNEKEDGNKYLIDEVLGTFNQTLSIRVIKNKETFLLHHILDYLKELCNDHGSEPIFAYAVSLKKELYRSLKFDWIFSLQQNLILWTLCEYNVESM